MIEDTKSELIYLSEMDSKTDNLAVTKEADVYEAIPIYLKNERKTQAYKNKMDVDINKIDTYELRKKLNTIKLRPIYEVIGEADFKKSEIPQMILCNNASILKIKINFSHLRRKIT